MSQVGAALVGSGNARVGMPAGIDVLRSGGSALDAVEAAVRAVEDDPNDHTVGYGGYPNLLGVVELDASIIDGSGRRSGAVGALQGYRAAITVARAVMDSLPHVFVVGEGAARLAAEIGLEEEDLLTPEAERVWRDGLSGREVGPLAGSMLSVMAQLATDPERAPGTVNVLARDRAGHLASAVSTSGWAWKHPGRLGDSPVVGAGNACDSRFGAAACTGWGELAIRAGTAGRIVSELSRGSGLDDACTVAMADVCSLDTGGHPPIMSLVAMTADGQTAGWTTATTGATYVRWHDALDAHEELPRAVFTP